MGNPAAPDILAQLKALQNLGITAHTQIVLTPGLNDEAALTQTITDLAALYPTVESIGIVPVGLTRFHRRGLRSLTSAEAAALIERIQAHQAHFRREHGVNLVYLSDEIYLLAERPIPSAEEYDDFRQLENGIGLTRQLLDEWEELRPTLTGFRPAYKHATLACGALIAPVLARIAAELSAITGASFQVTPIPSRLFGASVTVSGLLVGEDILFALRRRDLGDVVFLPRAMFDAAGERTLDELTPEALEQQLGVRVRVAGTIEELLA
jgi:putative radical SAM enzyme (TIGR03279 family)